MRLPTRHPPQTLERTTARTLSTMGRRLMAICLSFSHLFIFFAVTESEAPVVHTELGSLRGELLPIKGTENQVHAFLGVPFAKPPLGPALRLSAPQPVEGWEGVRDATKQPPKCVQQRVSAAMMEEDLGLQVEMPEVSEDCLYLNIYTPANRTKDSKLPVMVWIHGGAFVMGSASMYDGSALAAYENVVVVIIQYRLGLLGYLSTGDEHMAGNWGMLDQVQALKWVQEHIHNFGGDSNSVTIFGESAGGVSVSLLLLSPLTEGLFQKAVSMSGAATMASLAQENFLAMTQKAANMSGCSVESTEKMANCMKNLDMETIDILVKDNTLRFPAVVDGHLLTKPMAQLLENGEFHKVPLITGVNSDEGGYQLIRHYVPPDWTAGLEWEQVSNILFKLLHDVRMAALVLEEYNVTVNDPVKNRDAYTQLVGDIFVKVPVILVAKSHRDTGTPVYLYEFSYIPPHMKSRRPSFVGCDHGDGVFSVFGLCFTQSHVKLSDPCITEEEQLGRTMMSYLANFARTGTPNGKGLVHWPKYEKEEAYLAIGVEQVVGLHYKKELFTFVTEIFQRTKAP